MVNVRNRIKRILQNTWHPPVKYPMSLYFKIGMWETAILPLTNKNLYINEHLR